MKTNRLSAIGNLFSILRRVFYSIWDTPATGESEEENPLTKSLNQPNPFLRLPRHDAAHLAAGVVQGDMCFRQDQIRIGIVVFDQRGLHLLGLVFQVGEPIGRFKTGPGDFLGEFAHQFFQLREGLI